MPRSVKLNIGSSESSSKKKANEVGTLHGEHSLPQIVKKLEGKASGNAVAVDINAPEVTEELCNSATPCPIVIVPLGRTTQDLVPKRRYHAQIQIHTSSSST